MFSRIFYAVSAACISLPILISPSITAAEPKESASPEYMPAIRQELLRLGIEADCKDSVRTCVYKEKLDNDGPTFDVVLRYSPKTDTVYICIERFLPLADTEGPTSEIARRLLALNNEMVTAKFEWDRSQDAIRLSVVLNTDSNFDRRAFRSQILGLRAVANRLWPELSKLSSGSVSEP